ncbi:hypothetical protein AB4Y45_33835 [Paraburkholderia sp. EG287A]|uniref:hypothetical protein n=1 Tax=Paraburkholderia sp. EG287A TaxID=3237012 RepID=UPI0034D16FB1
MTNLDLFDDTPVAVEPEDVVAAAVSFDDKPLAVEPEAAVDAAFCFSQEAKQWGYAILEIVAGSGDRKTVLKRIKEQPDAMEELLQACLLIALRKAQAYARRLSAAQATEALFGWVVREPDLAHATGVFNRALFDISEVPMLPTALVGA